MGSPRIASFLTADLRCSLASRSALPQSLRTSLRCGAFAPPSAVASGEFQVTVILLNLSERFPFGFFSSGSRCGPPPFGASLSGCLSGHPFGFLSDILPVHLFPGFPYGPPSRASFSGCPPGPSSRTAPADLPVGRAFHSPRPVTPGSVLHRLSALRSEPPCFRRLSALPVRAGLLLCLCLAGSASLPSWDFSSNPPFRVFQS
jgi:hypothetical protein